MRDLITRCSRFASCMSWTSARVTAAFRALSVIVVLGVLAPATGSAATSAGFVQSTVATGLNEPTAIAFLPDGTLLVTEKGGALRLVREGRNSTLADLNVCTEKSMGLLGVAVDPRFGSNGYVYLYRTKPAGAEGPSCPTVAGRVNEVVRVRLTGDQVTEGP